MRRVLIGVLVAAFSLPIWTGAVASAAPVQCGDTLVSDTLLEADLGPCPGLGLRIGADNVVLDLGGHRLFGPPGASTAIGLIVGRSGVTVRNGSIADFGDGVLVNGTRNTLTGLSISDNIGPAAGPGAGQTGAGIILSFADDNVIRGNRVVNNGPVAGMRLFGSNRNVVDGNIVQGNDIRRSGFDSHGDRLGQTDGGIEVHALTPRVLSVGNVITGNSVSANGSHGIELAAGADGSIVERNHVARNGLNQTPGLPDPDGISINSNGNTVRANNVLANAGNGIAVYPSFMRTSTGALVLTDGDHNRIIGNRSILNGTGPSTAYDLTDRAPACAANVWSGNQFATFNHPCVTG